MRNRTYYVYCYINPITNEPMYIGRGEGNRAIMHLLPSTLKKAATPFHRALVVMQQAGVAPTLESIKTGLTSDEAWQSEAVLIHFTGRRRAGTGPLYNVHAGREEPVGGYTLISDYHVQGRVNTCWNQTFSSLGELSRDPRCEATLKQLYKRMGAGWSSEEAATIPIGEPRPGERSNRKPCEVWGEMFPSLAAMVRDSRCVVSQKGFEKRLKKGLSVEDAATTPLRKRSGIHLTNPFQRGIL